MKTFQEEQRFLQWWMWLVILGLDGIFIAAIVMQVILKRPFGDNPMSDAGLLLTSLFLLALSIFLYSIKLKTHIDMQGIHIKFYPFHIKERSIAWEELRSAEVRQYKPITEFGGWGYRIAFSGKGKAFTCKGNMGLQLLLASGEKILIGTQRPDELRKIVQVFFQV